MATALRLWSCVTARLGTSGFPSSSQIAAQQIDSFVHENRIDTVTVDIVVAISRATKADVDQSEADGVACIGVTFDGVILSTCARRRFERNHSGGFFKVFQPNKWRAKREKQLALAA